MKKLVIIGVIAVLVVASFFIFGLGGDDKITGNAISSVSAKEVTMYKSPNCGCCVGHAGYLEGKGFNVNVVANDQKLIVVKGQNNIPYKMRSCHTEIIGDYFIEGHVPIEAIEKLLSEMPDIDGIALPNMPAGSPGMSGVKRGEWIIYAIKDGQASEFMRI